MDKLNTGKVAKGNIYYESSVTPVYLTKDSGIANSTQFTVLTG